MRYFIKAYPMHEDEVAALQAEAGTGALQSDDIHEGLVSGIADEEAIARLADKGVIVQALGAAPDADAMGLDDTPFDDDGDDAPAASGWSRFGAPRVLMSVLKGLGLAKADAPGASGYWLADLLTGVTDESIAALNAVGAEIVERDPSGAFVLRTSGSKAALDRIPFVQGLRPYGVADSLPKMPAPGRTNVEAPIAVGDSLDGSEGPQIASVAPDFVGTDVATDASPAPISAARFEAICHETADRDAVVAAIEAQGGSIISSGGRAVRFLLNAGDIEAVAAIDGIASVAAAQSPQLRCDMARQLIGLEGAGPAISNLPFDGKGELIGVTDTGIDEGHPDFAAKRVKAIALGRAATDDASDPDGHGTHVAGTIAGDGTASRDAGAASTDPAPLRGIAPAADLYFQSVLDQNGGLGGLPESLIDLLQPAYDAGVRVHNNSWGAYIQSRYDSMALDIDQFVHDNPDFLPIIAAGNEGSCRPGISAPAGFVDYPSLGSPAVAKNGITVGASRSSRTSGGLSQMTWRQGWPQDFHAPPIGDQTISGDPESLAAFSSRGPVDNFRIKPDVVAPGTDIAATRSSKAPLSNFWGAYPRNRHYAFMGGTSMACPIVTGCAALTRQYYREVRGHAEPSAALLKATLINGTRVLTGDDSVAKPDGQPNYHQGFGSVDLSTTLPDPRDPAFELFFLDSWKRDRDLRFVSRKGRLRWQFDVQAAGELRITLVWTDYPARGLENQLRMILDTRKDGKSLNWVANADAPRLLAFPASDPRAMLPGQENVINRDPQNNVQVIRAAVEPGVHTLAVFADGLLRLPQDFALVATYLVGGIAITRRDV